MYSVVRNYRSTPGAGSIDSQLSSGVINKSINQSINQSIWLGGLDGDFIPFPAVQSLINDISNGLNGAEVR
jgi:hypothetical protein